MKTSNKILFGLLAFVTLCSISFIISVRANMVKNEIVTEEGIMGNGKAQLKNYPVADFAHIRFRGPFEVVMVQGDSVDLSIETDENLHELLEVTVEEHTLRVSLADYPEQSLGFKVRLSVDSLRSIGLNHHVVMQSETPVRVNKLSIYQRDDSQLTLPLQAREVWLDVREESVANLSGESSSFRFSMRNEAKLQAANFQTINVETKMSGNSQAEISVEADLDAEIWNNSKLTYKGKPGLMKNVRDNAKIKQID